MKSRRIAFLGIGLITVGLILSGIGAYIEVQPDQFQAVARIEIDWQPTVVDGEYIYDPYFIQTEFEIIKSEVILGKVIDKLNLNSDWGAKYAGGKILETSEIMILLKRRMDLRQVRNTKLIEITVNSDEPAEAARLANVIGETFIRYRHDELLKLREEGKKLMNKNLAEAEEKLKIAQDNVDRLRKELNVPDPEPANDGTNYTSYFEAKKTFVNQQESVRLIKSKVREMETDSLTIVDPTVPMVDKAVPPSEPFRPNRPLGAALLAMGVLLTIGGAGLAKAERFSCVIL